MFRFFQAFQVSFWANFLYDETPYVITLSFRPSVLVVCDLIFSGAMKLRKTKFSVFIRHCVCQKHSKNGFINLSLGGGLYFV